MERRKRIIQGTAICNRRGDYKSPFPEALPHASPSVSHSRVSRNRNDRGAKGIAAFLLSLMLCMPAVFAAEAPAGLEADPAKVVSPKSASEDRLIANYHSLGEIAGRTKIFRCANPVGDIADRLNGLEPTEADRQLAKARMQHLYDSGVRTVVSLQRQEPPTETWKNPEYSAVTLEKAAAEEAGLTYVAYSMGNRGKDPLSLQYMPEDTVFQLMESITNDIVKRSGTGGVAFHCKSGKDRTGLVAAYLRVKYQHWTADQAIAEMRQKGHVWKSFLKPDNSFSWHENHLRAIAQKLAAEQ